MRKIVLADPTKNCIRRSPLSFWDSLPSDKSLFTCKKGCGLPIGNLTSQVFANFYLSEFDHFIKPSHTVIGRRTKGNFVKKLQVYEKMAEDHKPTKEEKNAILSSVNSYLGIMRHYKSKKFRVKQILRYFRKRLKNHFSFKAEGLKIERKK